MSNDNTAKGLRGVLQRLRATLRYPKYNKVYVTDPRDLPIPGLHPPITVPRYTGLGDALKAVIKVITGKDPCRACNARRAWLNQLLPFIRRATPEFILWNLVLLRDPQPETVDTRARGEGGSRLVVNLSPREGALLLPDAGE